MAIFLGKSNDMARFCVPTTVILEKDGVRKFWKKGKVFIQNMKPGEKGWCNAKALARDDAGELWIDRSFHYTPSREGTKDIQVARCREGWSVDLTYSGNLGRIQEVPCVATSTFGNGMQRKLLKWRVWEREDEVKTTLCDECRVDLGASDPPVQHNIRIPYKDKRIWVHVVVNEAQWSTVGGEELCKDCLASILTDVVTTIAVEEECHETPDRDTPERGTRCGKDTDCPFFQPA